jgi:hypothetical protein
MSLDITSHYGTSHPGRPGPDELVPSRYALRIGDMDVLVVSDGALGSVDTSASIGQWLLE